jgi:Spy/CpxP family protein refolding chaperone
MFIAITPNSFAQPPECAGMGDPELRARNLENLRLLKMMEFLDLSDVQSSQFISRFVSFRKEDRDVSESIQQEVEKLAELLKKEEASENDIRGMVAAIEELRDKRHQSIKKFHQDIAGILTPIQLGKATVFEERFEKELISSVRGFRMRHMPPVGP